MASEGLHLHGMLVLEPVVKQQPAEGSSAGELVRRSSPAKQGWFSSGQQQQEQQEPPPGAILGYRLHLLAQRTAHELFEVRLPACWACMHACMHACRVGQAGGMPGHHLPAWPDNRDTGRATGLHA